MVLLLKQDGMEIDDGLVIAATGKPGVTAEATVALSNQNASSIPVCLFSYVP